MASSNAAADLATAGGGVSSTEEATHLLLVVVDLSEAFSKSLQSDNATQRLSVEQCLDSIVTFCNSYLLFNHENSVAVCIAHQAGSHMVYPTPTQEWLPAESPALLTGKYEPLVHMNQLLTTEVQKVMKRLVEAPPPSVSSSSLLSGALSKCLCYVQRCRRVTPVGKTLSCRLLVVSSMEDSAEQYVSTMNCIFAAQKNSIPIDACVLWHDSGFLQQAADITGGVYMRVPEPASLLHFVLWVFLPDVSTREHLVTPSALEIDYRASCFCHQRLINVGFVCSVCLSIFCQFAPICARCQTHFKLPQALARPKAEKSEKTKKSRNHKLL